MKREVLELFCANNTLIEPNVIDHIISQQAPLEYAESLLQNLQDHTGMILTLEEVQKFETTTLSEHTNPKKVTLTPDANLKSSDEHELVDSKAITPETETFEIPSPEATQDLPEQPALPLTSQVATQFQDINVRMPSSYRPEGKEYGDAIKIYRDVTGNSSCEGGIQNFTNYFNNRFKTLKKILRYQRREVGGARPIGQIKYTKGRPFITIAMVSNIRLTKQGHKLLELEDEHDKIAGIILNSNPQISVPVVVDDVIGIAGTLKKDDLIYIENIIFPEVPMNRPLKTISEPVSCAFVSDIHVGSKTFLKKSWDKFVAWLNGKVDQNRELAERIKYMIIPGDTVEGIGIYPDQEHELEIVDIYAQYEQLAKYIEEVPEHITIIIQPGNHDAVRPAEPQPTFPPEITKLFSSDVIFVGNPCYFSIHDIEILSYHGRSMDDYILKIPKLTYNAPIQLMQEMLTRRHLAPIYGEKTPIAPESQDYLVIDRIPDIFVTGHVHKADFKNYKGITLINASAWQTQTSYQKMLNFHPDPAKVAVVDLSTREIRFVDFLT